MFVIVMSRIVWSAPAERSVDGALDCLFYRQVIQSGVSRHVGIATALHMLSTASRTNVTVVQSAIADE
jgi:hypothetical protein